MPNHERLNAFPQRSRIKQECVLLPLLFNLVLEVLSVQMQGKEMKNLQIGKEEL